MTHLSVFARNQEIASRTHAAEAIFAQRISLSIFTLAGPESMGSNVFESYVFSPQSEQAKTKFSSTLASVPRPKCLRKQHLAHFFEQAKKTWRRIQP